MVNLKLMSRRQDLIDALDQCVDAIVSPNVFSGVEGESNVSEPGLVSYTFPQKTNGEFDLKKTQQYAQQRVFAGMQVMLDKMGRTDDAAFIGSFLWVTKCLLPKECKAKQESTNQFLVDILNKAFQLSIDIEDINLLEHEVYDLVVEETGDPALDFIFETLNTEAIKEKFQQARAVPEVQSVADTNAPSVENVVTDLVTPLLPKNFQT